MKKQKGCWNKILTIQVIDGFFSQVQGFMFNILEPKALFFVLSRPQRVDLHSFFVFFDLDIVFFDECYNEIERVKNFKPFNSFSSRSNKVCYVLEYPSVYR